MRLPRKSNPWLSPVLHISRGWNNQLEETCPCEKAPCGFAVSRDANRDKPGDPIYDPDPDKQCPQHGHSKTQTMRRMHAEADCAALAQEQQAKAEFEGKLKELEAEVQKAEARQAARQAEAEDSRRMRNYPMDPDAIEALLAMIFQSPNINFVEWPMHTVVAIRHMAEHVGRHPMDYTPRMNKYAFRHNWVPMPDDPNICRDCEKPFEGSPWHKLRSN